MLVQIATFRGACRDKARECSLMKRGSVPLHVGRRKVVSQMGAFDGAVISGQQAEGCLFREIDLIFCEELCQQENRR